MSQPTIAHFPHSSVPGRDHNPTAAGQARKRIASIPDPYLAHAAPVKEDLVGAITPVSPAAEAATNAPEASRPAAAPVAANDAATEARNTIAAVTSADTAANPLATPAETPASAATAEEPSLPKPQRSLPSRLRPLFVGLATFAILYLAFKPQLLLSQLNYLTQPKAPATSATQASNLVPAAPTISIPKISVNAPVVYATSNDENAILTDLQSGVVHYAGTALPGQAGNSVIFGHSSNDWWEPGNYKFVFVLLDKLVPGDTFTVNYNSHRYLYQVTSSTVVEPTDVSVLDPTPDPEMTLITCSPPGTSWKRLIVKAKQISPATTTTPATATTVQKGGATLPSNAPSLTDQIGSWWQGIVGLFGGSKQPTKATGSPATPAGGVLPATQ